MTPEASNHLLRLIRKAAENPPPDMVVAEALALRQRRGHWCCNHMFLDGNTQHWVYDRAVAIARQKKHDDCLTLAHLIRAAKHRAKAVQAHLDAAECGYEIRKDLRLY